eukprot:EG_transcript_14979
MESPPPSASSEAGATDDRRRAAAAAALSRSPSPPALGSSLAPGLVVAPSSATPLSDRRRPMDEASGLALSTGAGSTLPAPGGVGGNRQARRSRTLRRWPPPEPGASGGRRWTGVRDPPGCLTRGLLPLSSALVATGLTRLRGVVVRLGLSGTSRGLLPARGLPPSAGPPAAGGAAAGGRAFCSNCSCSAARSAVLRRAHASAAAMVSTAPGPSGRSHARRSGRSACKTAANSSSSVLGTGHGGPISGCWVLSNESSRNLLTSSRYEMQTSE